jgi:tetratricopeptide (TPR) repeat protein
VWLKKQNLNQLIEIDRDNQKRKEFAELKKKYKATQYEDDDPASPLFLILRNLENILRDFRASIKSEEFQVSEKDIEWLLEQELIETAKNAQEIHFRKLKIKYKIVGQIPVDPFYEIMLKLERDERLDPKQIIQLMEEGLLRRDGKIAIAHYRLEAIFYEQEYQRTGNKWNLPSASSSWRKADEPEKALKVTEKVNWNKVKESDLKSALLVTRGAAFRDLGRLDDAENCASEAMECQPESHQPYTLMGAICYNRSDYSDGDQWFEMAAERGANDMDNEIERVVRMTKDKAKRKEAVEYLLQKDPDRYGWAKSY